MVFREAFFGQRAAPSRAPTLQGTPRNDAGLTINVHTLRERADSRPPETVSTPTSPNTLIRSPTSINFPLAREVTGKYRHLNVSEANLLWEHGNFSYANMDIEWALDVYNACIWGTVNNEEFEESRKKVWANKGLAHVAKGEIKESCSAFKRAIATEGHEPIYLFLLGCQQYDLKEFQSAAEIFRRVLNKMGAVICVDYRPEGFPYKLMRTDVATNEQLAQAMLKLNGCVAGMDIVRVPKTIYFVRYSLDEEQPEPVSRWSPDSSLLSDSDKGAISPRAVEFVKKGLEWATTRRPSQTSDADGPEQNESVITAIRNVFTTENDSVATAIKDGSPARSSHRHSGNIIKRTSSSLFGGRNSGSAAKRHSDSATRSYANSFSSKHSENANQEDIKKVNTTSSDSSGPRGSFSKRHSDSAAQSIAGSGIHRLSDTIIPEDSATVIHRNSGSIIGIGGSRPFTPSTPSSSAPRRASTTATPNEKSDKKAGKKAEKKRKKKERKDKKKYATNMDAMIGLWM